MSRPSEPTLFDPPVPAEPYGAKRSGHVTAETSKASEPKRRLLQADVVTYLTRMGRRGATYPEVATHFHVGHGSASGALSTLHLGQRLERLTEIRGGCKVYVVPDEVDGRDTELPEALINPRIRMTDLVDLIEEVRRDMTTGVGADYALDVLKARLRARMPI